MGIDPVNDDDLVCARQCSRILEAWAGLSVSSRHAQLRDLGIPDLTMAILVSLSRSQRARLLMVLVRSSAAARAQQKVAADPDDQFAKYDVYRGSKPQSIPEYAFDWGRMGGWG